MQGLSVIVCNRAHNATGNSSNSNSSGDGEVGKVSPPHNDISLVAVEANQRQKWVGIR